MAICRQDQSLSHILPVRFFMKSFTLYYCLYYYFEWRGTCCLALVGGSPNCRVPFVKGHPRPLFTLNRHKRNTHVVWNLYLEPIVQVLGVLIKSTDECLINIICSTAYRDILELIDNESLTPLKIIECKLYVDNRTFLRYTIAYKNLIIRIYNTEFWPLTIIFVSGCLPVFRPFITEYMATKVFKILFKKYIETFCDNNIY